ncbi:hypothetical protein SNEBB_003934, partial [Seison nebaliae]
MDNDVVLMNRQPTLHPPSLMAHQVLILNKKNESLRFHYGNCKAYNADFDGDEMNLHFPQTQLARVEAAELLTSLIQDYIVGGTLMTMKNCDIIIRGSQLLNGMIDKVECGASKYGLIYSVYELHGSQLANALILSLGKVFILYIQLFRVFTIGIEDILIEERMQAVRHGKLKNASDTAYTTLTDSDCGIEEKSEEFAKLLYRSASINKLGGVRDDELMEID